jgi:hypothetical protein
MRRRALLTAVSILFCMSVAPPPLSAQERQEIAAPDLMASFGANVWLSKGDSVWEHKVEFVPGIFGGSRLKFRDVTSNIFGADGDLVLWNRLVLTAAGGWGTPDGGDLIDEDLISGVNFSRTRSRIDDGHIYFGNVAIGYRLADWVHPAPRRGFLDLLIGYQYWQEEYEAFGLADFLGFTGEVPQNTKVITHTWTWHSVRVGGRAFFPFPYGLGVRASGFVLPWSSARVEDVHHLRTDLAQNPSVLTEATGGFGWQLEGAITWTFWQGLGVEAGYRHWKIRLTDGNATFRAANGESSELEIKELSTERGGPFVGLYWRF